MTASPLDRPVWHALNTRQNAFAVGGARARRYATDVEPFAAARNDSDESLAELATLIATHGAAVLIQVGESPLPPGTAALATMTGVQMVARNLEPLAPVLPVERLTEADVPAMIALAALTQPGPFLARTHLLGQFWGVKENGKLLAMAGERMKLDGFTEVSGVCTHPDARGRGYAGLLSRTVATQIQNRGETPFLHAYATNTPAIRLYETLGFELRTNMVVTMLAPAAQFR